MENEQYYTVGTVPKSNPTIIGTEAKSISITHKYMSDRSLL